jgi:hypothetical protein
MSKIKLYIYIAVGVILIALCVAIGVQSHKLKVAQNNLENTQINYNALENEYNHLSNKNIEYKLNLTQLTLSLDSLNKRMNEVRKELKVKDSEIKRLGYIASVASRTDTLVVRDTIFRNNVKIDTTLTDGEWYKLTLHAEYPNIIAVKPEFKSEKIVVTSAKKVILNPKKCAFLRLFQKKTLVVETEVVESNPYISKTNERFLEVIK